MSQKADMTRLNIPFTHPMTASMKILGRYDNQELHSGAHAVLGISFHVSHIKMICSPAMTVKMVQNQSSHGKISIAGLKDQVLKM